MIQATDKQTFIGVWLHSNNSFFNLQDKMKQYLNQTFDYYRIFSNKVEFYKYINEKRLTVKIFLIVSILDPSFNDLINLTKQYPKIFEKVYGFLPTKNDRSTYFMTNDINDLFEKINKDLKNYNDRTNPYTRVQKVVPSSVSTIGRPSPSLSVFGSETKKSIPIRHMTKESLNFICFLKMTDVLQRISFPSEELLEMWTRCRELYKENQAQLDYIDELASTYDKSQAIMHYTKRSCLSHTINKACHTENMKDIFTFRVYVSDLHKQLAQCHEKEEQENLKPSIHTVYRGKPLPGSVLQQLIDNEGGLISMNGFLSTTIVNDVAAHYHGDDQVAKVRPGYRPVLFEFKINKTIKQPYAYIGQCSTKPEEVEVLFSLGTIWHIESVTIDKDPCIIKLTPYDELESSSVAELKKYQGERCDLSSIGDILLNLGNNDQAQWFYEKMLRQASLDAETKGNLYYKIGMIRFEKNDYSVALEKLETAVALLSSSINDLDEIVVPRLHCLCDDQSPFITMFINIGIMYEKDGQFTEAMNYYKRATKIKNESMVRVATAHNYLGLLYYRLGKYEDAREEHNAAMGLVNKSDPNWTELQSDFDRADQRCRHRMNKDLNKIRKSIYNDFSQEEITTDQS